MKMNTYSQSSGFPFLIKTMLLSQTTRGRIPYPFAPWPESEPRPWENHLENHVSMNRTQAASKVIIRADPAMNAVGAQEVPMTRTANPVVTQQNIAASTKGFNINSSSRDIRGEVGVNGSYMAIPRVEERGLLDLIFGELESKAPRSFKGIFDVLRGRYSLEAKPSAPTSSSMGFVGSLVTFAAGRAVRQLLVNLPVPTLLLNSVLASPAFHFFQSIVGTGILLFFTGIFTGFITRNWFMMNPTVCRLCSLVGFMICVTGSGGEFLLGACTGSWISVKLVFKQSAAIKRPPREVSKESQPVNWVHERWMPSKWEVQLDDGTWSTFPHEAQELIEEALQNHQSSLILKMGDYGEHCYGVDLVSNIATNLSSSQRSQLPIRRTAVH